MKNVEKSKLKRTDIGFIPVDWDVRSFGELLNYEQPGQYLVNSSEYTAHGETAVLTANKSFVLGYTHETNNVFNAVPVVIFDDFTTASKFVHFQFKVKSSAIKILKLKNSNDDLKFIFEKMQATQFHLSDHKRYWISEYRNINISYPKPEEQKAIAAALSDVDGLIDSIEQLIAKKRDMKTAAMQQLLTGKKRLPGFTKKQGYKNTDIGLIPVDWDVMPISSLCEIVSGGTPSTTNPTYWFKGSIPWCTPTDITGTAGKYLYQTDRNITTLGLSKSSANLLPAGSLLLCSRATIGVLKIANTQIATNQGFKSLVCHSVDTEFMYYKVLTLKDKFVQLAIGSTFLEIHKKDIAGLCLNVPKIEEQKAIATILSDMDTEINALEQRLAKAKSIKAGMMQELLTGRTRLVKPAKSAK